MKSGDWFSWMSEEEKFLRICQNKKKGSRRKYMCLELFAGKKLYLIYKNEY
jgi:hypothetical protein